MEGLLGWVEWQWSILDGATQLDGGWLEDFFTYLIVGIKEEPGLGGDPFLQGLIAYNKIIAQEKVTFPPHVLSASLTRLQQYVPFLGRSNLPAVLLALSGNRLIISTAIFTDATYADKLLPITLCTGFHAPDKVLHIASVFVAINKCTERLRMLYKRLPEIAHSIPPARVLWPNPIVDPSQSTGLDHSLEIFPKVDHVLGTPFQTIDEVNKPRAMHLATMQIQDDISTREVLVKFTAKYNKDAHHLLAKNDPPLAPTLHSCTRVIGDLFMVVMQYISESEGGCIRNPAIRSTLE